jgi:hypothetical protein
MSRHTTLIALLLIGCAAPARAATTLEYLFTGGFPTAVSDDGNAIAGNTANGDYEPFRWTRSGGYVPLGMASAPTIGISAGIPGISADGTRVSSTIVGPDTTYYTAGLWTQGSGWQTLVPPIPPGFGQVDYGLAGIWGLSGDGLTAVGLLWGTPRAHAFYWRASTGAVDLGSSGGASRANNANHDGSVIVGWDESNVFGYRGPAVWTNGVRTNLAPHQIGEVHAVTPSGHVIGGMFMDTTVSVRHATLWKRVGNGWSPAQKLPLVPGTENNGGLNLIRDLTADGRMAVGYCSFAGDPFFTTGFVWTETMGMMDVVAFLASQGVLPDPSFSIADLTGVTPDGTKIVGWGRDTVSPFTIRAVMIHVDPSVVSVEAPKPVAATIRLLAAPNPVRHATTIAFDLPREQAGALTVHDSSGRLVRRLLQGTIAAGPQRIRWDACDDAGRRVPSGIYFTRLVAGSAKESGKLVVVD